MPPDASAATPYVYGEKRPPECPRCGRDVKANEHVVRLTLMNADHATRATDMQGTFHHACAAELFSQFFGKTRGEPLREAS